MALTLGSLLNLGRSGETNLDGDSFANKFGSLFQTDNQRLLAEYSDADIARQSTTARANLERIASENLEINDTGVDTSTGEERNQFARGRNLVARSADQTSPTESNVQFRAFSTGPAGALKA